MKKLLVALAIQFALPFALAIQAFPTVLPPPLAEGAKAIDIRVDSKSLYFKTSSDEIVRVDKHELLGGKVLADVATGQKWVAIKEPEAELVSVARSNVDRNDWSRDWLLGQQKVQINEAYCSEGHQQHNALKIDGRKIDTGLEGCMALFEPLYFDGKLWFRTNRPWEYSDSPGVGILIFDVVKKRCIAKISKALVGGDSGLMRFDADLNGVWVVNDRAIHFFDYSLKRKALAYYSEQFDPNGKNWSSVVVSKERRKHNQFAVAARIIMTSPITPTEQTDVYAARLLQSRWATADGIADYQQSAARLPSRVRANFSFSYSEFERQHYPYWKGRPMTKANGGNEISAATNMLSCLYEKAGAPLWLPRALVSNIAIAAEDMNWDEAQLYEPKCAK